MTSAQRAGIDLMPAVALGIKIGRNVVVRWSFVEPA